MTRPEDIDTAIEAGADAIGLIFYPGSARAVALTHAGRLRRGVPAFVDVVALFVNPSASEVRSVIKAVGPDLLQFHGDEPAPFCDSFNHRYMKAFRVGGPGADSAAALAASCAEYRMAAGWLFDSYTPGYGGSGLAFDHALLQEVRGDAHAAPLVLSGGLKPDNVQSLVSALRPWAVDVSSGVEAAPGIKDARRIHAFIEAVRRADESARAGATPDALPLI